MPWRRPAIFPVVPANELAAVAARLVEPLISWPTLSAPMAEANTGASRAAVQRNLTLMQARGLIREVTGQGRFRLWCCRL